MNVVEAKSLFRKWLVEDAGFARQVSLTFITRTAILLTGFALSVIMARYLGPEGLGTYTVLVTVAAVGGQFGNFGLHTANAYFIARERGLLPGIVGNTIWFSLSGGLLAGLTLMVVLHFQQKLAAGIPFGLLLLSLSSVPFNLLFLLGQNILLGLQEIRAYNFFDLLSRLVLFAAITLLLVFCGQGVGSAMVATVLSSAVFGLVVTKKLYPGGKPVFNGALFKQMLGYGLKIYLACIFAFLLLRFDLLMVNCFLGAGEAGVYSITVLIGDVLCMLPGVAGMILFPKVSGMKEGSWEFTARVAWLTTGIMLVVCPAAALLAGPFVFIFYGDAFAGAVAALWWLLPGVFGLSVNTIFMNYFAGRGMPLVVMVSPLLALIINVSLNLYCIPAYGIKGAAFASSVAYLVFLTVSVIYLKVRRNVAGGCMQEGVVTVEGKHLWP